MLLPTNPITLSESRSRLTAGERNHQVIERFVAHVKVQSANDLTERRDRRSSTTKGIPGADLRVRDKCR